MDIQRVAFTEPPPQTRVAITLADCETWQTDTRLPADTGLRVALAAWLEAGGVPEPYAPPEAPPLRVLSVLQFRDRLTAEEELAITAAGMVSPAVRVWLDRLAGAQEVSLDDPRTVAGLHDMAAAGLLAAERVTEILA